MWIAFHLPRLFAYYLFLMHLTILACCYHVGNHMTLITLIYWIYFIKNDTRLHIRLLRPYIHIIHFINILYIKASCFSFITFCTLSKKLYWYSFFDSFLFINDLSFTKCVTRKSFTAYLLSSLLHSCFGWFGTIWMGALIYRCKKVRRKHLSDKACIETNRALSRTVLTMKLNIVEHSNF